jgi:hypothetical protein
MEPGLSSDALMDSGGCLADSYFLEPFIITGITGVRALFRLSVPVFTYSRPGSVPPGSDGGE